ncbi:MAG: type II toxin-antitoxin system VapC family toxin [Chloroflexi bacterium]|nr:type II toxin-antitoxin system VapC family toxin [Chloroflexota bacterium]
MIILDTNVVSDIIGPAPSPTVAAWLGRQPADDVFVSAVTEAELRYGAEILPAGRRRDRLLSEIEDILGRDFAGRILPFGSIAAQAYAAIVAARRAAGRPITPFDAQIAAIARSLGASVATRDRGGFEGTGVDIIDPWGD